MFCFRSTVVYIAFSPFAVHKQAYFCIACSYFFVSPFLAESSTFWNKNATLSTHGRLHLRALLAFCGEGIKSQACVLNLDHQSSLSLEPALASIGTFLLGLRRQFLLRRLVSFFFGKQILLRSRYCRGNCWQNVYSFEEEDCWRRFVFSFLVLVPGKKKSKTEITARSREQIKTHKRLKVNAF